MNKILINSFIFSLAGALNSNLVAGEFPEHTTDDTNIYVREQLEGNQSFFIKTAQNTPQTMTVSKRIPMSYEEKLDRKRFHNRISARLARARKKQLNAALIHELQTLREQVLMQNNEIQILTNHISALNALITLRSNNSVQE